MNAKENPQEPLGFLEDIEIPRCVEEWQDRADEFRLEYFDALCWAADIAGVVHLGYSVIEGLLEPARKVLSHGDRERFDDGGRFYSGDGSFRNVITSFVDYAVAYLAVEGDIAGNYLEWVVQDGIPAIYIPTAAAHSGKFGGGDRLNKLHGMDYAGYLLSPEWKRRREVIIEIAGHRCQACNRSGRLHVHHRTYTRRGFERKADLVALCADCHQVFHDHRILTRVGKGDT